MKFFLKISSLLLFSFMIFFSQNGKGQVKILDEVVGVVGANVILQSDIESQYQQYLLQGGAENPNVKCDILYQMLINKLLLNQAVLDSLEVSDIQVETELDKRMRAFIQQIGSQQKLEERMGKTVLELKAEFRQLIKDQLLTQSMQSKITKDITASPSDVRAYYDKIPKDSLPKIESEYEVQQIVKYVPISDEEKKAVKDKLNSYKQEIMSGKSSFEAKAVLYSQDPGTATKGGELGFFGRGDMQPSFEAAAFKLKPGEISEVIETPFGFHILQLIERRGDQINVRHILLRAKVSQDDVARVENSLDSLAKEIRSGTISFSDAAARFSDDENTKQNGGLMENQQTGATKFQSSELDKTLFFEIDKLKIGDVSKPLSTEVNSKPALRIIMIKTRTSPHIANLKDDYQKIQNVALSEKQNKTLLDWVKKKRESTFVNVIKDYQKCDSIKEWMKNAN
jgi:peptidyl-prolyl cis-trans isomerase SurA